MLEAFYFKLMNIKLSILNGFFLISLFFGILISTSLKYLAPISGSYLYCFFVTIPLFVLQLISINGFSRKIKKGNPKIFKQACMRSNSSQGNSINVASLFNENIPFIEMKDQHLINEWNYTKRVVIYSMLSFIILIILYFI